MVRAQEQEQNTLRLLLYSGIALIVISMLFLGRAVETSSFLMRAVLTLAAPFLFYGIGIFARRNLDAPLAAPGIIATGAWLVGVGLIHLYLERYLLPEGLRPYYWLAASLFAAVLITFTGHQVRIWLLFPLVPLTQVNAMWAIMRAVGLDVTWWAALSFLLVLVWRELPLRDAVWRNVYRVSAILLAGFLLLYAYILPGGAQQTLFSTWGAGIALALLLWLRHGWTNLVPLALLMLVAASAWGLPPDAWSPVWVILSLLTIGFVELLSSGQQTDEKHIALELSTALALILSGGAALLAKLLPFFGVWIAPPLVIFVFFAAGVMLLWVGWRREIPIATHGGLWLIASGWADTHLYLLGSGDSFGLWLALLAGLALLVERVFIVRGKTKHKETLTVFQAMTRWALADLVIGLSALIVLWSAFAITAVNPVILMVTLGVVVGLWLCAGLIYRLPIFLHLALWIAPIPYAFLLTLYLPAARTLPALGLAWQLFGVALLAFAHANPRYRPSILLPFFIVGYILLGFGLTLTSAVMLPLSLGIVTLVSLLTGGLTLAGWHPAWTALVARFIPPAERPYAYKNVLNVFMLFGAWLLAIWLQIMLGMTAFTFAQQGLALVLLSGAWFMLGRLLPRIPNAVGWTVYSAGWLMWLMGLLQVFFSPAEAVLTAIFGLIISSEALYRSRVAYWIPVFIMQALFSVLQAAWLLSLPANTFLLLLSTFFAMVGIWHERRNAFAGRIAAVTGSAFTVLLWLLQPDLISITCIGALIVTLLLRDQHWHWLLALQAVLCLAGAFTGALFDWRVLLATGIAQVISGVILLRWIRPRRHRKLSAALFIEQDWANPFLWFGGMMTLFGLYASVFAGMFTPALVITTVSVFIGAALLNLRHAPYLPAVFGAGTIALALVRTDPSDWLTLNLAVSAGILGLTAVSAAMLTQRWAIWWIRPLRLFNYLLFLFCAVVVGMMALIYHANPVLLVLNALLLALTAAVTLAQTRRSIWLWTALALLFFAWTIFIGTIGAQGILWYSIPVGIGLIALAHVRRGAESVMLLEAAAMTALIGGSAWDWYVMDASLFPLLLLGAQIIGLAVYGIWAGRRMPFLVSATFITGAGVLALVWLNVWLIPLGFGVGLLGAALLLETRRAWMLRLLADWRLRWERWQ